MAARERLTLAEGLLVSLQSDPTVSGVENARALLASENGDVKLTLRWGGRGRPSRAEAREVRSLLEAEVTRLRETLGPGTAGKPAPHAAPAAPAGPKKVKGKARGGTAPAKPTDPNDPDFEKLHPRAPKGRVGGGEFAQKGDGMDGQPDQRVQQLQARLTALGFKVTGDGQFGGFTEAAVKSFQEKYGLSPTGKVDRSTLETLRNPPPKDAATANAEIEAQANPPKKSGSGGGGSGTDASSSGSGSGQSAGSLDVNDKEAVKAFQRGHGLDEDGVVGDQTKAAMKDSGTSTREQAQKEGGKSGDASKSLSSGDSLHKGRGMGTTSDKATKDLQSILDALGYNVGEAGTDGRFGPDTEKAVKKLQRRYGLKADGIVGKQTKALLKRLAKRHAKNTKALDAKALATEDSDAAVAEDAKNLPHGETKKKIRESAPPRKLIRPLQEDTTSDPGSGGYDYLWTQTPGGGLPGFDIDLPDYSIRDGFDVPDDTPSVVNTRTIPDGRDSAEIVAVLAKLTSARDRLAEAVAMRVTAQTGTEQVIALARERVLRDRVAGVEAEVRAAGVEEGYFAETVHPRDRLGRWREVFGAAKRMHTTDKPKTIGGYKVAKISDAAGKQFVIVGPDGRAKHAGSPADVADVVAGVTDFAGQPTAETVRERERIEIDRYGHTLSHHVPGAPVMGVDAPPKDPVTGGRLKYVDVPAAGGGTWRSLVPVDYPDPPRDKTARKQATVDWLSQHEPNHIPMGVDISAFAHRPEEYFDTSDPRTEYIPVALLRLSKSPESQPKSVARAGALMDSAVRGGISKRRPISVRRTGDGSFIVLDGNATTGVALDRGWPYIPVIVENS